MTMSMGGSSVLRMLLIVLLLVVILYGFNRYIYEPNQIQIRTKQQELSRLSSSLLHIRKTVEDLPRVKAELENLQREWQDLEKLIPRTENVTDVIHFVSQAERQSGVFIISIEPQPTQVKDLYTENPYRLQIEGSYHNFARFLTALSELQRIVNVSEMNLSMNPETLSDDDIISITCLLTSYTALRKAG